MNGRQGALYLDHYIFLLTIPSRHHTSTEAKSSPRLPFKKLFAIVCVKQVLLDGRN